MGGDVGRVPYTLRRSNRARWLQAVVRGDRVEIVVPRRARAGQVRTFLREAGPWIRAKAAAARDQGGTVMPHRCVEGALVQVEGMALRLRLVPASGRHASVERSRHLVVRLPLVRLRDESEARRVLGRWLREEARERARRHIEAYSPRLGVRPRGLRIKGQETVWGSCGRSDLINVNWRLIGAPPRVLEYIVVHELCHLRQRNHGPRFWRLVEAQMPDFATHRDWLRDHGQRLG
jgi:predicted metal-dependent hydrolase